MVELRNCYDLFNYWICAREMDGKTIKLFTKIFALEHEACNPPRISVPDHLEFRAEWNKETITSGEGPNILGDNGGLFFEESTIQIPKVYM